MLRRKSVNQYTTIWNSPLLPVLEEAFEGVALCAPDPWRFVYVNPTLSTRLGISQADLQGRLLHDFFRAFPGSTQLDLLHSIWRGGRHEAPLTAELIPQNASPILVVSRLLRVDSDAGLLLGIIISEMTDDGSSESHSMPVRYDPLTGLPDREFLLSRLSALLEFGRSANHHFAILFVDLDNFKQVNDAHGHLIGDDVLREVARRLSHCVRDGDYVVRFGGDEFVVLIERIADSRDIQPVVERIHRALGEPIALPEGEFQLSVSIGTAEASPDRTSPEDMLAAADRDMYASKRQRP
jgi:diguanylate cyclase (GGDEF)-like protein